ncbi:MAG: nucleoside kinase, partial [Vallitaleaceae bacterium]|nr:nucleoside kinase [Vallitaleaceae bacterium]
INKMTVTTNKAIRIFKEQGMDDKVQLLNYRSVSNTNLYELEGFYDYYFGYMVPNTACLKNFDLFLHDQGIMIQYASKEEPNRVADFHPDMKLFETQKETANWANIMEVTTVGELNDLISMGNINDLMLVAEALMEKKIASIADQIIEQKDKKFVFIAGPSSSGKTTFAHRLAIQLKAHGMKPQTISVDNYFVNREMTPKDEQGEYDFECLEAIDVQQFNQDMTELLAGKPVDIPVFNFVSGKREYKKAPICLDEKSLLIIEGIHGLNDELSYSLPAKNKFKIYISALTQLNLDFHNRIPTTDGRLIRRIVRDYQYRGASALRTLKMWPSVRRGEEKYIFPFQEDADVMFNSSLIYEIAVLKQYAVPLLYSVPKDLPEYLEAKRLIKFLEYILGITSEQIPQNSLLREFVGGSCFRT